MTAPSGLWILSERENPSVILLSVSTEGVVTAFGLAPAECDERKVGEFLVASGGHDAFLADKGFSSVA